VPVVPRDQGYQQINSHAGLKHCDFLDAENFNSTPYRDSG
jgi:hypothetical protein